MSQRQKGPISTPLRLLYCLYLFRSQFTHINHSHGSIRIYLKSPCICQLHVHLQSSSNSSSHPKLPDRPTPFHFALQKSHPPLMHVLKPTSHAHEKYSPIILQTSPPPEYQGLSLTPFHTISFQPHHIQLHSCRTWFPGARRTMHKRELLQPWRLFYQLQALKSMFNQRCSIPALGASAPPNHNRRYFVRKCLGVPLRVKIKAAQTIIHGLRVTEQYQGKEKGDFFL